MKRLLFVLIGALFAACSGRGPADLDLIPAPRTVEHSGGAYRLPEVMTVACGDSALFAARDFLAHALPATGAGELLLGTEGDVCLALDRSLADGA